MKELLICVRFSLNDGQSQVRSFDLNIVVFSIGDWVPHLHNNAMSCGVIIDWWYGCVLKSLDCF